MKIRIQDLVEDIEEIDSKEFINDDMMKNKKQKQESPNHSYHSRRDGEKNHSRNKHQKDNKF